jgi:hypothetical protein
MAPDPRADLMVIPKTAGKDKASSSVVTSPKITHDEVRAMARKFAGAAVVLRR